MQHRCANCLEVWGDDQIVPIEETPGLGERLTPGDPVPSGECPECGCFVYGITEGPGQWPKKIVRVLESGGLGHVPPGKVADIGADTAELLETCGQMLDDCCASEILGRVTFQADDGKWYRVHVEAVIEEADEAVVEELLEQEASHVQED